jgi:hypothetical protein
MGSCSRFIAICAACLFCAFPGEAATVCILIVENGLPSDAPRVEASSAWEAGLMDAFFEAGHIVTNGAMVRTTEDALGADLPAPDFGLGAAREGGSDYLALAVLDYAQTKEKADAAVRSSPIALAFRFVDLGSGRVLTESSNVALPKTVSGEDEKREAGEVARNMMKGLKER